MSKGESKAGAPGPALAETPAAPRDRSAARELAAAEVSLYRNVLQIKEQHGLERLGIAFHDSETSIQWSYNGDAWFHAASTMKLAVLLAVYRQVVRGEITLDDPVHVRNKFLSIVDRRPFKLPISRESDPEVFASLDRTLSVKRLAYHMITTSSNFATNLLVDVVGVETIQATLRELGIEGVNVLRGVADEAAYEAGLNNEVTANGLLKLLRLVAEGRAFSPEACADMLEILLDQRFKGGIPAGLPREARVAHKTGNISTVEHDAGIVYLARRNPYVVVILTQFATAGAHGSAVAELSKDIFQCLAGAAE
jgi:beta-lactamase class A